MSSFPGFAAAISRYSVLAQGAIGKVGEVFPEALLPCPGRIIMALRL
jgi:hypothetical protein